MKQIISFLGFEIINTGNGDGWVLRKESSDLDVLDSMWECHLGNYSSVRQAMESAVTYFMIKRSEIFHAQIHHRTLGTKTSHEWFVFKGVLEDEGIPMPDELTHDTDYTIVFKQSVVKLVGTWDYNYKYDKNKETK